MDMKPLGRVGLGVICPVLLWFLGRSRLVLAASQCDSHQHLCFPLLPHTQPVSGIALWLSRSVSRGNFVCCLPWPSLACVLFLAAENAHLLVCPNREVSLPEQTSL